MIKVVRGQLSGDRMKLKINLHPVNFDETVKSQKNHLLSFRRRPESSYFNSFWTPAFAGVTGLGLFTKPSTFRY